MDLVVLAFIVLIAAGVITAVFGPVLTLDATAPVTVDRPRALLHALVSTSLSGAYFVTSWVLKGATPSQLALGLRVHFGTGSGTDDGRPSIGGAIVRWLLLLPPLGTVASLAAGARTLGAVLWSAALAWQFALLVTTALSPTRRGLHDRIAGSTVLRTASGALGVR